MNTKACPKGCGPMVLQTNEKQVAFRGEELNLAVTEHVCPQCGLTATDLASVSKVQRQIAEHYRMKVGLLTGREIRTLRQAKKLTQEDLAGLIRVGVASIKRWEKANIQSESMDKLLRAYLQDECHTDAYTGNRPLSLPRIKLVIKHFEKIFQRRLLKKTDKLLFVAKYLWYADMLSFRELGRSMTGATYAALPYGPQLNNYLELVDEIKRSDQNSPEPLSADELRIIQSIAQRFPHDQNIYDAAHRERIWKETPVGHMISYVSAADLTQI